MPTGPSWGGASMYMVENDRIAPLPKLASPWQFGPITRIPRARATSRMCRSLALPASASVSPKPEVMTIATLTPSCAHCSTASTAASPGTTTIATSGASGRSASDG